MNNQSDQDKIEIISERVKKPSICDDTDKVLNQSVKRKLRQQYPSLDLAGKKIRVVSSQGYGVIDPSRVKIVSITRARVPLRPVSSVRKLPLVRISNASASDKENTPPEGTREDQESESRCLSDPSFFSVSSDGEKRPPVSPEPCSGKTRYPSSLDLLSLSSDEDDENSEQRISGDSLGSSNNNNNCKKGNEDRLDNEATITSPSGPYDPCNVRFYPLDDIKTRLVESNMCSKAFLDACRDHNINWIRLDVNWNVEISASALRRVFSSDKVEKITNPAQVYDQAVILDNLVSFEDEEHDSDTDRPQHAQENAHDDKFEGLSSASSGNHEVDDRSILNSATWSTDALLNWHDEAADQGDQVAGPKVETQDVEEVEGCAAAVSPPSLCHRPREDMMAVLGLVTHEQARINR